MVSIILPAHNAQNYIGRTLESILSQSYRDIEVIVIDDASTDSTLDITRNLSKKDSRVKIIALTTHSGVSASRLKGVQFAKGEWIMFVDDDDSLPWFSIEVLLQFDNGQRDIISGTVALDGKIIPSYQLNGDVRPMNYIIALLQSTTYNGPCAKLIRANLFNTPIIIPPEIILNEDILMMVNLAQRSRKILIINNLPVYNYTQRIDSRSKSATQNLYSWLLLFDRLKTIVDRNNDKTLYKAFVTFCIHRIFHFLIQRGVFVSASNPKISGLISFAKNIGVDNDTLKQIKCIKSMSRQRWVHIKWIVLDTMKNVARKLLSYRDGDFQPIEGRLKKNFSWIMRFLLVRECRSGLRVSSRQGSRHG